jgi:hypothetical protein
MRYVLNAARDHNGRLLTPTQGRWSLDSTSRSTDQIDDLTEDICTRRQDQIEASVILLEDLSHCGLTRNESRALGLLMAGWGMGEAAGIMKINRKTLYRAIHSMQTKIRPILDTL